MNSANVAVFFLRMLFVWQGHYASFGVFSLINIMRIGVAKLSILLIV